jgi:hypothetical protein
MLAVCFHEAQHIVKLFLAYLREHALYPASATRQLPESAVSLRRRADATVVPAAACQAHDNQLNDRTR